MSLYMIIVVLCFARLTRPVVVARWRTCLWLLNLNVINISLLALVVEDGLDFGENTPQNTSRALSCWSVVARLAI